MAKLNPSTAKARIKSIFSRYKALTADDDNYLADLKAEKLYELFVLSQVLRDLRSRGYVITFVGTDLVFKAGPGYVKQSDPHFDVFSVGDPELKFQVFVDIETNTLGLSLGSQSDESTYHELDIAVLRPGPDGRPAHDRVALGVECKSGALLTKGFVRQILGLRRELSFLVEPRDSMLSEHVTTWNKRQVPAEPASEIWLAFTDSGGLKYQNSPRRFGIDLKWLPVT